MKTSLQGNSGESEANAKGESRAREAVRKSDSPCFRLCWITLVLQATATQATATQATQNVALVLH